MFRHDEHFQVNEEVNEDDNEEEEQGGKNENAKQIEDDSVRLSEIEPVLLKVEKAMKKVSELLNGSKLKCDKCDFTAKNQNGLKMHMKAKHTDKSN